MPTPDQIITTVNGLTDVQRLIHLSMRLTEPDIDIIYDFLFEHGKEIYEDTLVTMAQQLGCRKRVSHLTDPLILSELSALYRSHAVSIVATFNYDLAFSIKDLFKVNPKGNRHYYAKHIQEWEMDRLEWKGPQVALMTAQYAQNMAVDHFSIYNPVTGYGLFYGPDDEKTCPICKRLLDNNPYTIPHLNTVMVPVHVNCRHVKRLFTTKATNEQCKELWMGGRTSLSEIAPSTQHFLQLGLALPVAQLVVNQEMEGFCFTEHCNSTGKSWIEQYEEYGIWDYKILLDKNIDCIHGVALGGPGSQLWGHADIPKGG